MKPTIFTLTRNEQRVVILIVAALVIAAFVRYWQDASRMPVKKSESVQDNATPFPTPADDTELDSEDKVPSPQSSP